MQLDRWECGKSKKNGTPRGRRLVAEAVGKKSPFPCRHSGSIRLGSKTLAPPPPAPIDHLQLRLEDYTGARHALAHGIPPPESKGGRCRTQHLWLSLAKLANQAGGVDAACADSARGADIQRRLELAEVRQELIKLLPQDVVRVCLGCCGGRGGAICARVIRDAPMMP